MGDMIQGYIEVLRGPRPYNAYDYLRFFVQKGWLTASELAWWTGTLAEGNSDE